MILIKKVSNLIFNEIIAQRKEKKYEEEITINWHKIWYKCKNIRDAPFQLLVLAASQQELKWLKVTELQTELKNECTGYF